MTKDTGGMPDMAELMKQFGGGATPSAKPDDDKAPSATMSPIAEKSYRLQGASKVITNVTIKVPVAFAVTSCNALLYTAVSIWQILLAGLGLDSIKFGNNSLGKLIFDFLENTKQKGVGGIAGEFADMAVLPVLQEFADKVGLTDHKWVEDAIGGKTGMLTSGFNSITISAQEIVEGARMILDGLNHDKDFEESNIKDAEERAEAKLRKIEDDISRRGGIDERDVAKSDELGYEFGSDVQQAENLSERAGGGRG